MKTDTMIALSGILWFGLLNSISSAEEDRVGDAVARDIAKLQGQWETIVRTKGKTTRQVQTIKGTTSTLDRFDKNGQLFHSHTAQFKLHVTDELGVFTFFDLKVTAGSRKGQSFKGPLSYVYVLKRDSWVEARGLLRDQKDGEPRLMVWKRIVKKNVAVTHLSGPDFLFLDDDVLSRLQVK